MKPMYSPLRYPGGKLKLYNRIVKIMEDNGLTSRIYVEPYAGGFGIGIKLLFESKVKDVIYNDYDRHLYNFWYCVLNNTDELCAQIRNIDVTIEEREKQKMNYANPNSSQLDDAIATLFLNRVNFSGVIKGGPIGGYSQTGKYKLDCRFRRDDLIETIQKIAKYKSHIKLYNEDAIEFMKKRIVHHPNSYFLNIDPPYVMKGHLLYQNYYRGKEPHVKLSKFMRKHMEQCSWIITYDDADLIKEIYNGSNWMEYYLVHNAGGSKVGKEIMIYNKCDVNLD